MVFQNRRWASPLDRENSWSRFCTSITSTLARKVRAAMLAVVLSYCTTSRYRLSTSDAPHSCSAWRSRQGSSRPKNRMIRLWWTRAAVRPSGKRMV